MAAKMCNTINQNMVEPCDLKLVDRYIKQFGTLLDNNNDNSNANTSQSPIMTSSEESNERENVSDYMQPNAKQQEEETATDMEYLRRLESSIETYLESLPPTNGENNKSKLALTSSQHLNTLNAYLLNADDAILSDVDLESFDSRSIKLRNTAANTVMQLSNSNAFIKNNSAAVETASLSNFHNIRDVLLNIHQRLEHFLKSNGRSSSSSSPSPSNNNNTNEASKLEHKIGELKEELQRYVVLINQKKEEELRRFSESMCNQSKRVTLQNAFMKKEINPVANDCSSSVCLYDVANEAQKTDTVSYYSNDSILNFNKCRQNSNGNCDGFMLKNCYDDCSYMTNCCDSVQYYSMLINEERSDNLLNDPPQPFLPPRYQERDKISLIYRSSDEIIKQWNSYNLNAITIKPKKNKLVKLNLTREKKMQQKRRPNSYDLYTFTLDYHRTRLLQMKLEKERKIRFICRLFFYFFGLVCFILVVIVVQSMISMQQK